MKPSKITEWYVNITYLIGIAVAPILLTAIVYAWIATTNINLDWLFYGIGVYTIGAIILIVSLYSDITHRKFQDDEKKFWKNVIIRTILTFPTYPIYYYAVVKDIYKNRTYVTNKTLLKKLRNIVLLVFYISLFIILSSVIVALLAVLIGRGYNLPVLFLSKIIFIIPIFFVSLHLFYTLCLWDYANKTEKDVEALIYYFGQMHWPLGVFKYYCQATLKSVPKSDTKSVPPEPLKNTLSS